MGCISSNAARCLDRRWGVSWERARLSDEPNRPRLQVRVDRMTLAAGGDWKSAILRMRGFKCIGDHLIWRRRPDIFLPYGRVCTYEASSLERIQAQYAARSANVPEALITLIPRDSCGLNVRDATSLEDKITAELSKVELAIDFGHQSGVDIAFVRATGVFGKSKFRPESSMRGWNCYGSRGGGFFTRSYYKGRLGVHRVELQLGRSFLRRHGIVRVRDLHRLAEILPGRYILFAQWDTEGLFRHLQKINAGKAAIESLECYRHDLPARWDVLRRGAGLKNLRRFLIPLPVNAEVRASLQQCLRTWSPKSSKALGAK